MAYDTWDWTRITGSGKQMSFQPIRHDPLNSQQSEAGYIQTAPEDVRGIWIFKIGFDLLLAQSFTYIVNFHYAHRGGQPFYLTWPFDMAGIPTGAETANPGGYAPWDSEIAVMAGLGPTYLVYIASDELQFERLNTHSNLYRLSPIELRQV